MARIIFMGTPQYAVPALESLIKAGHEIPLLLCQPDKKQGRGHKLIAPPTKKTAELYQIPVFQPKSLKKEEVAEKLSALDADYFVVIAYGKILPRRILDIPRQACINVHGSLLPKWRGAAPIQFSLMQNEKEAGVCSMLMDEGMDTGDVLLTRVLSLDQKILADELAMKLSEMSAEIVVETIDTFSDIKPQKQDSEQATYTRLINADDRKVDWNEDAAAIWGRYRALTPAPGIFTSFRGKRLMIRELGVVENPPESISGMTTPGSIVRIDSDAIVIQCGKGFLRILKCQPENKKAISAADLVNGYQIKTGEQLT